MSFREEQKKLVSNQELKDFMARRKNKDSDLTKRCSKLGAEGWWARNRYTYIKGVCVGGYVTYNGWYTREGFKGWKNYWYIIRTPKGLRMAMYLATEVAMLKIEKLPRGKEPWIALLGQRTQTNRSASDLYNVW